MGQKGTIARTRDGRLSWTSLPSGTLVNLTDMTFPAREIGYVVGDEGTLLKTVNGGNTLTRQNIPAGTHLRSVELTHPDTGYAAGYAWTRDGWVHFTLPVQGRATARLYDAVGD